MYTRTAVRLSATSGILFSRSWIPCVTSIAQTSRSAGSPWFPASEGSVGVGIGPVRPKGVGVGVSSVNPPGPDGGEVAIPGGVGVESCRITGGCVAGTRVNVGGTRVGTGMGVSVGVSRRGTGVCVEVGSTTAGVDVGGTGVDVGGTRVGMGVSVGVTRPVAGVFVDVGTTMTIAGVSVEVGAMMMMAGVSVGGATCPFGAATAGRSCSNATTAPNRTTATMMFALAAALSIFLARIGLRATTILSRMRGVNNGAL